MPKTFSNFQPYVTDVQPIDVYPLQRSGANKAITGQSLLAAMVASIATSLVGSLGIALDITTDAMLAAKVTTSLPAGYLLLLVINDELHVRQFQSGTAAGSDVVPTDNPSKRWRKVL